MGVLPPGTNCGCEEAPAGPRMATQLAEAGNALGHKHPLAGHRGTLHEVHAWSSPCVLEKGGHLGPKSPWDS